MGSAAMQECQILYTSDPLPPFPAMHCPAWPQLDESPALAADTSGGSGRVFRFWVRDTRGSKLDYGGISALMYTLSSVLGYRSHPTAPPDQEMLLGAQ